MGIIFGRSPATTNIAADLFKRIKRKFITPIVILLIIVVVISNNNNKENRYKELAIVLNGESVNFEVKPVVDLALNKELFISVQDIKTLFDENVYEDEKEIITTCGDNIAYIDKKENVIQVNDSDSGINNIMRETPQGILLSLQKMQDVYGLKVEYNKDINTISIEKVSDETAQNKNDKEIKLYNNYNNISGIYNNLEVDESKYNIVSPKMFFIGKKGTVKDETNHSTAAYDIYSRWAESNKLTIIPRVVSEEDFDVFETYPQRKEAAIALVNFLKKYRYDGLSLDIKNINNSDTFKRFVVELSPRMKKENKKFIWIYNKSVSKDEIRNFVDNIIEE